MIRRDCLLIPAVIGATHATEKIKTGTDVTISCAEGDIGNVYQGTVAFQVTKTSVSELRQPRTAIMVNVGTPEMAFRTAMQPQAGVSLARMELIISDISACTRWRFSSRTKSRQPRRGPRSHAW